MASVYCLVQRPNTAPQAFSRSTIQLKTGIFAWWFRLRKHLVVNKTRYLRKFKRFAFGEGWRLFLETNTAFIVNLKIIEKWLHGGTQIDVWSKLGSALLCFFLKNSLFWYLTMLFLTYLIETRWLSTAWAQTGRPLCHGPLLVPKICS